MTNPSLKQFPRYLIFLLFFTTFFFLGPENASGALRDYVVTPSSFEAGSRSEINVRGYIRSGFKHELCEDKVALYDGKYPDEAQKARYNPSWGSSVNLSEPIEFGLYQQGRAKPTCDESAITFIAFEHQTEFDVDVSSLSPGTYSIAIETRDMLHGAASLNDWHAHSIGGPLYFTVTGSSPSPSVTLTADPTSISSGSSSTLTWVVSNAISCTASGNWDGEKEASRGSESTGNLTTSKSYTLSCIGVAGTTATASASVSVGGGGPSAPSCTLSGSSHSLSWTTSNADLASINQGVGSVTPVSSGSTPVMPSVTTTYTLTATGSGGTGTCNTIVTIGPPPVSGPMT